MGRKKKPKARNDTRGYSQGGIDKKKKVGGVSTKNIQVTSKAHEGLVDLLGQLDTDDCAAFDTAAPSDQKRLLRKVTNIHDGLHDLGFKDESIEAVVQALGHSDHFNIEAALDWLCLNVKTEDLPALFTEGLVREEAVSFVSDPNSLTVITAQQNVSQETEPERVVDDQILPHVAYSKAKEHAKEENKHLHEDDGASQKAWLLQQYQYEYEDDDDDEQEELDGKLDDPKDEVQETEKAQVLSPEELRLAELEKQLEQDEKDLNDDAANYMRSKYETKELQNRVKKSRKMVQGLRKKVAQLKAREAKQREATDNSENEDEGGMFSIFDSGTDVGALTMKSAGADKDDTSKESKSETKEANTPKIKKKKGASSSISSVPKDWTGKTPKKILEEWCQKRKSSKPQYQKLARTSNGCRVLVRENAKRTVTIEQEGPFATFGDAQEFLATEALYALNPTLPLYRLFPPVFRDLWRSWMDREKEEKKAQAQKKRDTKKLKMKNLAGSIPSAKATGVQKVTTILSDNTEDNFGNIIHPPVLDSWEDDSSNNEEAHQEVLPTAIKPTEAGMRRKQEFTTRQASTKYQNMLRIRKSLPMYEYRKELLKMIDENQVTVLCAETGAGKTTQAGQFILEEALFGGTGDKVSILCTQPRRVAAISVAERVSEEMCEKEVGGKVGYHIRMETKRSSRTQLLFCTTGVVLRRLQDDPNLTGVTHILVDEVHERQWQIDFLLIALRALINTARKDLKVVLMSATLDAELFCSFFQGAPLLNVPGRTFPVSSYYLEDLMDATDHIVEEGSRYARREHRNIGNTASLWVTTKGGEKRKEVVALESESQVSEVSDDYPGYKMSTRRSMDRVDEQSINYDLIQDVLELILVKPQNNEIILPPEGVDAIDICRGAVLVFLPGLGEIRTLTERLENSRQFGDRRKFEIIPLHSTLSPKDQRRAFLKPPNGCQKIILSTNIAETSVTIPDVVCVLDTGLVREVRQNKKSFTSTLVADWCSRASAKQRSGRAGRVQPGICCKLYSSRTAKYSMKEQAMPELQRVPLEEVCLTILAGGLGKNCMEFLQQAPQPPSEESVVAAIQLLQDLGAIDASSSDASSSSMAKVEHLTPLGQHLAKLPVDVRLGKMLIFGCLFCCLDKTLTVAASLSCKSPFSTYVQDAQQAEAKHKAFAHATSDFFTICNVWDSYHTELDQGSARARKFCDQNYLNRGALTEIRDMRNQFLVLLRQIGFISQLKAGSDVQGSQYNINASKESVIGAVICAGLYPNIAHVVTPHGGGDPTLWHGQERVHFHSSSVNAKKKHGLPSEWVAFFEKFATHRTYVSATSYIDPFSLLLFGGKLIVKHTERKVLVDDWIELKIAAQTGILFRQLRIQMDSLLESMMEKVDNISDDRKSQALLEGIVKLLSSTEQNK